MRAHRPAAAAHLAAPGENGRMELGLRDRVYLVTGGSPALVRRRAGTIADGPASCSALRTRQRPLRPPRLAQDTAAAGTVGWVAADNGDPAPRAD